MTTSQQQQFCRRNSNQHHQIRATSTLMSLHSCATNHQPDLVPVNDDAGSSGYNEEFDDSSSQRLRSVSVDLVRSDVASTLPTALSPPTPFADNMNDSRYVCSMYL